MKKKKITYTILIVLFIALIALPAMQQLFGLFKLKPLSGERVPEPVPQLTIETYADGSFQKQSDAYLRQNFGFNEWLIRLYNQYIWSAYRKTEHNFVIIGKEDWLFNYEMLQDHFESLAHKRGGGLESTKKNMEQAALTISALQKSLKQCGTSFFICIAPSKDMIYPQYLPKTNMEFEEDAFHANDYLVKRFAELGVNCVDFNTYFQQIKDTTDHLMPKGGSHWSNYAATHVNDSLIKYMESISGLNISNIKIGEPYSAEDRKPDSDLELLLNLMYPIYSENTNVYADVSVINDSTAVKPRLLSIGDSFFWNLSYNMPLDTIFSQHPFWYYKNKIFYDDKHKFVSEVNLRNELIDSDIVMMVWCPINLYNIQTDFLTKSALSILYDDKDVLKVKEDIIQKLASNEKSRHEIEEKAEKRGRTFEKMLEADAQYCIDYSPSHYFKELKTGEVGNNEMTACYRKYFHGKSAGEIFEIKECIRKWRTSKTTMEFLEETAAQKNQTLELTMLQNASWTVKQRKAQNSDK